MKKLFTYLFLIALVAFGNQGVLQAQDTYKKYHINEDFSSNAIPTKPSTWTVRTVNNSSENTTLYGGAAGVTWTDGMLTISGSGGGNRGAEIIFPTPQTNPNMSGHEIIYMEFDWIINNAVVAAKNALGLVFMDNDHVVSSPKPIFGIYLAGTDGFFHYWNLDVQGPEIAATPGTYYGAVFTAGNQGGGFRRQGNDATETNTINESTRTSIAYTVGNTYHVTAALNFTTKRVVSLTIADLDVPENTGTITDQPFIDTEVTNVGVLATVNTRGGNIGNGDNSNFTEYFDNLEIYVNEISLGKADVSVNYLDQDGQPAKAPRVIPNQEISTTYTALLSDKESFIEGGNYYAYNALATTSESAVVAAGGVNINLIFKKSPATTGLYTWTGATGPYWDELDNNFSVNGGTNISYQNNNSVAFSNAGAEIKEVVIPQTVVLGSGDVTISADGYTLSGDGKLTGIGKLILNPGNSGTATIGVAGELEAQLVTGTLHVKHASSAKKYTVVDNSLILLEAGANISTPIEGSGGEITINSLSDNNYASSITNVSKLNIILSQPGRLSSSNWTTQWTGAMPENSEVNVINGVEGSPIVGFGVGNTSFEKAKVNLGDSIRLLRFYNENSGGTDTLRIGELKGTSASVIESGFVDGRKSAYMVGGLNTDAVFAGEIRNFTNAEGVISTSNIFLYKVGTGKWTLSGQSPNYRGTVVVRDGTLEITGVVGVAGDTTKVTVQTGATLDVKGYFGTGEMVVDGTLNVAQDAGLSIGVNPSLLTSGYLTVNGTFKTAGEVSVSRHMYVTAGGTFEGSINLSGNLDLTGATVKLNIEDTHTNGAYDVITVAGDVVLNESGNTLDITVVKATAGDKIKLIDTPNGLQGVFGTILINGKPIDEASFVWDDEAGELLCVSSITGINNITTSKIIKEVRYYDITGKVVTKDTEGFIITKTIYTDGSSKSTKVFKYYSNKK
jgi:autotransporter-associated beta strand protein